MKTPIEILTALAHRNSNLKPVEDLDWLRLSEQAEDVSNVVDLKLVSKGPLQT